jgi:FkbM family methyltransferase
LSETVKFSKRFSFNFIRKIFKFPPFEKALSILSQNKDLNSFIGKMIPENNLYAPDSNRHVKRNGIWYLLDISDYQNWLIYFGLNDDKPAGLYELVKPGAVMIDIGANIGQTAMNFAIRGGNNSVVYAFEPDPVNYSKAIENLKKNSFKNIHYFNIGLGAENEELSLKINSPLNRGGNRIDRGNSTNSVVIKIRKLDDVLEEEKVKKTDLIKIDVEGFEFEVLKGARKTIMRDKPVLYVEIDENNLRQQGTSAKDVIQFISGLGYGCQESGSKNNIDLNRYNFANCHIDIICRPISY